MLTTRHAIE